MYCITYAEVNSMRDRRRFAVVSGCPQRARARQAGPYGDRASQARSRAMSFA